jgi:hypothetical protein
LLLFSIWFITSSNLTHYFDKNAIAVE